MTIKRCYPVIVGASVGENQFVTFTQRTTTDKGITCKRNADGTIELSGTATDDWYSNLGNTVTSFLNHKILIKGCPPGGSVLTYSMRDGYNASDNDKDFGNGNIIVGKANFIIQLIVMSGTALSTPIIFEPQAIDLTKKFGSTIADYAYSLERATAGSGIAWLRSYGFISDDYIPYNTGTIESVEATAKVVRDENGENAVTYPLGSDVLRGIFKLDANNQLYADGDVKSADGTITRYYGTRDYQEGDESLADAITDGTTTVYKLTTPTIEQSTPFTSSQLVYPDGTEQFVTENGVPVGHETKYQL